MAIMPSCQQPPHMLMMHVILFAVMSQRSGDQVFPALRALEVGLVVKYWAEESFPKSASAFWRP
jgi:hypothetical protein